MSVMWIICVCVCVCIYTCLTAYRLYKNYRCYQITLQWNIFTQIGSGAKCWLDIYHWAAGLAVTGRIRDVGQNVLQCSIQRTIIDTRNYTQILFFIAFLEGTFILNKTISPSINYMIIRCINDNITVIHNNYGRIRYLILLLKIWYWHAKGFLRNL